MSVKEINDDSWLIALRWVNYTYNRIFCIFLFRLIMLVLLLRSSSIKPLVNFTRIKSVNLFYKLFTRIKAIYNVGSQIKNAFDSIENDNMFLSFTDHSLKASIPTTLLFCHEVIRLDTSISEEEFCDRVKSTLEFKL